MKYGIIILCVALLSGCVGMDLLSQETTQPIVIYSGQTLEIAQDQTMNIDFGTMLYTISVSDADVPANTITISVNNLAYTIQQGQSIQVGSLTISLEEVIYDTFTNRPIGILLFE